MCFSVTGVVMMSAALGPAQSNPGFAIDPLDKGWEFHQQTDETGKDSREWLPATILGEVHLDLLANKKIPAPFYRDNEAKLQ